MSATAEDRRDDRHGGALVFEEVDYLHPEVVAMTADVQRFYASIYGSADDSPLQSDEFAGARGAFFLGRVDGRAVAMGGWRFVAAPIPGVPSRRPAEIRRMYVVEDARGRGYARGLLAHLESTAAARGADWLLLETGQPQVAALALYRASGYQEVRKYGHYAWSDLSVNLGKALPA